MSRLFGTDGVRGLANRELTPELAFDLGRAAGTVLGRGWRPRFLVGQDPRRSSGMLEAALVAGLASVGADVERLGVVTTPGLAFLVREAGASAAAMVSASHNPAEYNGIKFFSAEGFKLPDAVEDEIEALLRGGGELPRAEGEALGAVAGAEERTERYVDFLAGSVPEGALAGLPLAVDCANGAASRIAPAVLKRLGARLTVLHAEPDGLNINRGSGSLHPEALARAVRETGAWAGLAFDGDADRCIAVDEEGNVLDGDQILAVLAMARRRQGRLPGGTVVGTVMSNLGLERALAAMGLRLLRTRVGDRYVLEAMLREGCLLGGEPSGHVILRDLHTTGDGILTGLQLLAAARELGAPLSELARSVPKLPQVQLNVPVAARDGLEENPRIARAREEVERSLAGRGRLVLRSSGTEPVVRVMVEAEVEEEARAAAERLARVVEQELRGR
ncbi:MAG: phosphoglucosamine mutase [Clostridia bacterium]|nr:phosphoglucosamine mutase [Clostridia bacterium]